MGYEKLTFEFDECRGALVWEPPMTEAQIYYEDNKEWIQEKVRNRIRLHTLRLNYIKNESGCMHCRESDPGVLEFNHKNASTKLFNIGRTKGKSKSWEMISQEILKCEVLCANCHKRVTAREHGKLGYTARVCDSGMPT